MNKYSVCLDIGGTKVLGAVFDENRKLVFRLKKKTKATEGMGNIENIIISVVSELIDGFGININKVDAIAAGAPGVVDQENGVILFSPNLPWRNYPIREKMQEHFGKPFYIGNDGNVYTVGEWKYGAAKGYSDVIGLCIGTGIGGGMVLDGQLYTGNGYKGAEMGHLVLNSEGPLCNCGQRGCLESFSSKIGMTGYIRQQNSRGRSTLMEKAVEKNVFKSKYMREAYAHKDPVMLEAIDRSTHHLAIACGSFINIFSPEVIVLGGGVMEALGDVFLEKILHEVDLYSMPSIRKTVKICKASLEDDSNLYGALAMIDDANKKSRKK